MTDKKELRLKYSEVLQITNRFGDWSLEKYEENPGWVVYHWKCGFWTHTFYTDQPNRCAHCIDQPVYPPEIETLYTLLNYDLMHSATYNATSGRHE